MKAFLVSFLLIGLLVLSGCHQQLLKPEQSKAPHTRVLLKEITALDSLRFQGTYILNSSEADYEFGRHNRKLKILPFEKGFKLFNANRYFVLGNHDRVSFKPQEADATFMLNGNTYRGGLTLLKRGRDTILALNYVDIENYLKGVVPSEMPSANKAYLEALKAQAICARTYTLKKMLEHKADPYDVFADTRDQVYRGQNAETELADLAVNKTRGDVLMFNDSLATVFYHSTCGGQTEAVQNVWPNRVYSYLQPQKDVVGDQFACSVSPLFRWQRRFFLSDLDHSFEQMFGYSLLKKTVKDTTELIFSSQIMRRSSTGRVRSLQIVYGDTSFVLNGYDIRRFFSTNNKALPSTLFYLRKDGPKLILFGGGYGHGVGLCQWGALHMSEMGFKYYDILVNKYFKGTYLKKVY